MLVTIIIIFSIVGPLIALFIFDLIGVQAKQRWTVERARRAAQKKVLENNRDEIEAEVAAEVNSGNDANVNANGHHR